MTDPRSRSEYELLEQIVVENELALVVLDPINLVP